MRGHLLAQRRALTGCVLAAAAVLAGCTTTASGPTASGTRLTIYVSDPATLATDQRAQDVVDAEKLAFTQLSGQVTAFKLTLSTLSSDQISSDARTAIKDSNAVAYLGDVVPGQSAESIGITNALDLLQVSPTDTAVALTQSTFAVPGSPGHYYESLSTYGHTFARVVPTTSREAVALISEMQALGVKTLAIETDGSDYGAALASAVRAKAAAASLSVASSPSGADAVLYAGSSRTGAAAAFQTAASANPALKLFAPSALADPGFVAELLAGTQKNLYVTTPGLPSASLTSAGQTFISAFRSTYGHAPDPAAIFGYAAMQAVIQTLKTAGSSVGNRTTVVSDFMKRSYPNSVIGPYSIDKNGDTSFDSFELERVKAGRLVPVKALQG